MFTVVTSRRKRPLWSPRTVAISAAAHFAALALFVSAAESTPRPNAARDSTVIWIDPGRPHPPAPPTPPAPPQTPEKPVFGDHKVIADVQTVPTTIPPVNPNQPPEDPSIYNGIGTHEGNVIVPNPPANPPTATPPSGTLPSWDAPLPPDAVDVLPAIANQREAERMLERVYPPVLRDAGVTGRTTVTLIIDRDGNVEPGSVTVQETSADAFRDAAVRAVEKFHFRPARLHGQNVSVVISIPIEWKLQD